MNVPHLDKKIRAWLCNPLPSDVRRSLNRLAAMADVQHVAVMPDIHLAQDVCVGTVVATRSTILPTAVGGDIGCGMAALGFDAEAGQIDNPSAAATLLAELERRIPPIRHQRRHAAAKLPPELHERPLSHPRLQKLSVRDGLLQLGTLGRGNHFVELQADHDNRLWLLVHSGSRGMGQAITAHHAAPPTGFAADSPAGAAYLADAQWAIAYARCNRLEMVTAVAAILRDRFGIESRPDSLIHCHHNHVRREIHFGAPLWVHRKGALSAAEGEPGVIPGSMGTRSYHVSGRGCVDALCSSSHGAGRALSRHNARQSIGRRQFEREMRDVWHDPRRTDHLRDEAPSAYKDITAVMRAQRDLTRIERELRPVLCYKGA